MKYDDAEHVMKELGELYSSKRILMEAEPQTTGAHNYTVRVALGSTSAFTAGLTKLTDLAKSSNVELRITTEHRIYGYGQNYLAAVFT